MSNAAGTGRSNPIRLIGKIGLVGYLRDNCNLKEINFVISFYSSKEIVVSRNIPGNSATKLRRFRNRDLVLARQMLQ